MNYEDMPGTVPGKKKKDVELKAMEEGGSERPRALSIGGKEGSQANSSEEERNGDRHGRRIHVNRAASGEQGTSGRNEQGNQEKKKYRLKINKKKHKYGARYTEETINVCARIFKKFDKNRDSLLSAKEFGEALVKINAASESTKDAKTAEIFREVHAHGYKHMVNSTAKINFDEFLQAVYVANHTKSGENNELKQVFKKAALKLRLVKAVHNFIAPHKSEDQRKFTSMYSWCPPPIIFLTISMLMLGTFIYYATEEKSCGDEKLGNLDLECPKIFESTWAYHYDSAYKGEIWRFITYMFLHVGAAHITSNLLLQIVIGIPLEMVHGWWRPTLLYFLGGLAGSCCVSMFDDHTNIVGASGGVYALLGAHVANIINYWERMPYASIRIAIFGSIFVADVASSAYQKYVENDKTVSYSAHTGGALCGLALGTITLDEINIGNHNTLFDKIKNWSGLWATIISFLAAIIYNAVNPQKTQ